MRLSSGYEDSKPRMEMIPLMDVMFLNLLFFVYASFSMTIHRGLKVELPSARGVQAKGEQAIITILADSSLALNKRPLPFNDLVLATVALVREKGTPVLISADRAAPLGTGIELLGKLKNGGVERVAFQVSGETPKVSKQPPVPKP